MEDGMRNSDWSSVVTGIAIGVGIGAALGILFAPQSGEDTREYLMGAAKDRLNETKDRFGKVIESGKDLARQAQDSVEGVKSHLKDVSDAGQRAYRDAAKA
jgi:gas vesicle protein